MRPRRPINVACYNVVYGIDTCIEYKTEEHEYRRGPKDAKDRQRPASEADYGNDDPVVRPDQALYRLVHRDLNLLLVYRLGFLVSAGLAAGI